MKKNLVLLIALLAVAGCAQGGAPEPSEPNDPGSTSPIGAPAYVDEAQLIIMESYPVQVAVVISGNLPTPCHALRHQVEMQDFGAEKRVDITVSSEAQPDAICTQVLEPFKAQISLDLANAPDSLYTVYVNGELVGEFNYPG